MQRGEECGDVANGVTDQGRNSGDGSVIESNLDFTLVANGWFGRRSFIDHGNHCFCLKYILQIDGITSVRLSNQFDIPDGKGVLLFVTESGSVTS